MHRVYNFSAGPATLPTEVLERVRDELLDYHDAGASLMELSHRGNQFKHVAEQSESDLRELLSIPADYRVLFLQGGATSQFALVPMNLASAGRADYVLTGSWGKKAFVEAQRLTKARVAAGNAEAPWNDIPAADEWQRDPGADYLHITGNETIAGVEFHTPPDTGDVPLVSDMSSDILSRPLDVSRYGLIYAGAQKNIGPAGLTIVIVREELLTRSRDDLPSMFSYKVQAQKGSMFNTPATFAWYVAGLVFQWLKEQGGVEAMAERNDAKAAALYGVIDASAFYSNPVALEARSRMNVPFTLANPELDSAFLEQAAQAQLINLRGHRSVGGIRASIYNAMPMAGVHALVSFMEEFEKKHG